MKRSEWVAVKEKFAVGDEVALKYSGTEKYVRGRVIKKTTALS
jgi:hypothetical protein